MEHTFNLHPLLVVTLLAVAVPVLLQRFRVPIIAGEILAGIIVGPTVSDLLGGAPQSMAGIPQALRIRVSDVCSLWLVWHGYGRDLVIMSLIFSTTSLGVVMPVLKERELTFTDLGQYILVASVVGDFATVFLVSAYVTVYTAGLSFEIMLILVLLAATFLVYRLAHVSRRHLPLERLVEELSHATGQLDIRGSLALAVVFIALAQGLGVEVILGAFLAGAIVSGSPDAVELAAEKLTMGAY